MNADIPKLSYQWHAGYDPDDEFEEVPQWGIDTSTTIREDGDAPQMLRITDTSISDDAWIQSDTTVNVGEAR